MKKYLIELSCWNGANEFTMELDDSQKEFVDKISEISCRNSKGGYQPTIKTYEYLEDKACPDCGKIMRQSVDTFVCDDCWVEIYKD